MFSYETGSRTLHKLSNSFGVEVKVGNCIKCVVVGVGTIQINKHDESVRTLTRVMHVSNLSNS